MWLLQTLKLSARHSVTGRGCGVLLRFAKTSATSKPLRIPTLAPSWWGGGTCWDPILLARQAVAALGHAIFLASVPQPRWTETAGENPPCPRHHLHRPRLHPTACPGGVRAGQARTRGRRHSAPPLSPSQPRTQTACSGRPGEGEEKSALVSGGRQECPRQGARPSLLGPAGQTEGSKGWGAAPGQLAWKTPRGASTGPRSGSRSRGAGRPGGHEAVPGSPRCSPSGFSGGANSPPHSELGAGCRRGHLHRLITCLSASAPGLPPCRPP